MKATLVVLLVGVFALFTACHRKASTPVEQAVTTPTENPNRNKPAPAEPKPEAYQVVGFQKTACFGKCPVYQVKFFSDGTATWNGQHNVERKGWYEARVDKAVLTAIREKADEVKFWDLDIEYPQGRKVADLPSTVTFLRNGDMVKTVVNTHQAPAELESFEDYLEGVINGLNWQAKEVDK